MTVKEFAHKYDIPLGRVKAAMGHRKGGIGTIYEDEKQYDEGCLREETFHYLFKNIMISIECLQRDKEQLDRVAAG